MCLDCARCGRPCVSKTGVSTCQTHECVHAYNRRVAGQDDSKDLRKHLDAANARENALAQEVAQLRHEKV